MKQTLLTTPLGELSFFWQAGNLRSVKLDGVEVIRGICAPVRDEVWGTVNELESEAAIRQDEQAWYATTTTRLEAVKAEKIISAEIEGEEDRIVMRVDFSLTATDALASNRAGFCVLHPLQGVKGSELSVTHSDGTRQVTAFPERISPGQPVQDIVALSHEVGGILVNMQFQGEVFEMEDQRNWSDASYKTYCRPLSLPLPIRLKQGETLRQSIVVDIRRRPSRQSAPATPKRQEAVRLPQIFLAVEPEWLGPLPVAIDGLVMRAGGGINWTKDALERLRTLIADDNELMLDLELVVTDPEAEINELARRLAAHRLTPQHVTGLPAAYLKSHQPDGPWPGSPQPEELFGKLSLAFPQASMGAGMLTYFTELNRRPPQNDSGCFVTYSTSAIVHAADTVSVFETLEALPDIFSSAGALAPGKKQRLGLVAIAMRSNPYGPALFPPGDRNGASFATMTRCDRRHKEAAGAAFGAVATMLAGCAGVERICLGSPAGPFGLMDQAGNPTALARAIVALRDCSGKDTSYRQPNAHTHELKSGDTTLIASTDARDPHVVVRENSREETIR